jgi:hypothetical protein
MEKEKKKKRVNRANAKSRNEIIRDFGMLGPSHEENKPPPERMAVGRWNPSGFRGCLLGRRENLESQDNRHDDKV